MSSETGVIEIKPENIKKHGRLEPGKMFLVDMKEGRIVEDDEIKKIIVNKLFACEGLKSKRNFFVKKASCK